MSRYTRDYQRRLEGQSAVVRLLAGAPSFEAVVPQLLETMAGACEWPAAMVWRPGAENDLVCLGGWAEPRQRPFVELCSGLRRADVGAGDQAAVSVRDIPPDSTLAFDVAARAHGIQAEVSARAPASGAVLTFFVTGPPDLDGELSMLLAAFADQVDLFLRAVRDEDARRSAGVLGEATMAADLDAIIVTDLAGVIIHMNPAAEKTFGYTPDLALGKRVSELLIPARLRTDYEEGMRRFAETGTGPAIGRRVETTALRVTGKEFQVEVAIVPVTAGGRPLLAAFMRDISGRRQQEEWVSRANESQSELLSLIAHEVRSPLAGMVANIEVLSRTAGLEHGESATMLEELRDSGERLSRVVSNMLALGRLAEGKAVPTEPVLLQRVVDDVVGRARSARPGREIVVHVPDGLPPVQAEPTFADQVLDNLLSNAHKYGPPGKPVHVTLRHAGGWVEVEVRDEGGGLSRDEVYNFFAPFFRSDRTSGRAPGIGLGLTVCKRLVQAQQGRIWADSPPEGGTVFGFALPVIEFDDEP